MKRYWLTVLFLVLLCMAWPDRVTTLQIGGPPFLIASLFLVTIFALIPIGIALFTPSSNGSDLPDDPAPFICHKCNKPLATSQVVQVHLCSDPRSNPTPLCYDCWTILRPVPGPLTTEH